MKAAEIRPLFSMFLIICNYPRKHTTKPFELYQVENDKQQKMPTIIQVNHTASSSNYDYDDDLDVCAIFLDRWDPYYVGCTKRYKDKKNEWQSSKMWYSTKLSHCERNFNGKGK